MFSRQNMVIECAEYGVGGFLPGSIPLTQGSTIAESLHDVFNGVLEVRLRKVKRPQCVACK